MKKIYFLCLLFCISFAAGAQTTVTIYASGALGSYTTGSAIYSPPPPAGGVYTRSDGIIAVSDPAVSAQKQTGYAVFNLSSIPSGATISQVVLGVRVTGFTLGAYGTCNTYVRLADYRTGTYTTPVNLYNACTNITPGATNIFSAIAPATNGSYDNGSLTHTGEVTMVSVPGPTGALCTFVGTNAGAPAISVSFSGGGTDVFNFKGEDGILATSGLHAPYLQITYCYNPTGVTATATPNPICAGSTLTLNGTASGATSFQWRGPGGFSASTINTTNVVSAASAGVYTFTALTACGTFSATTTAYTTTVVVNTSPAAIVTPTTTVCSGNSIFLSDITAGGVWSSSNTSIATVINGRVFGGATAGVSVISYTLGSCPRTASVTVNNPPTAISGPTEVCASGGNITLVDGTSGGTWTASNTTLATIDPLSGLVTGVNPGGPNVITYLTGACPAVTYSVTTDPLPAVITGAAAVCENASVPLSDATTPGAWSSSNTTIATVSASGVVTGVSAAAVTITYTLPTGCYRTKPITVNPLPAAITGPSGVCIGLNIGLSDATPGGTWSSSNSTLATVVLGTGVTTGAVTGNINVIYTLPVTACFVTHSVSVNPLPAGITGPIAVCSESIITLNDLTVPGGWSSQSTAIATVDPSTGDVTGVAAGVTRITYTLSGTGCYATYSITVNPLPTSVITPAGPTTFCVGGNVTLNATVSGGYTYIWYSNGMPNGAITSSYVSNSTELVTVKITDANGCSKTSAGEQITLIPAVTIVAGGPTVFCYTGNVLLSVPLAPGILYQWRLNGVSIPTGTANTYAATLDGVYTCDLTVPGGCFSRTPPFTVVVHPLPNPIVTYTGTKLVTSNTFLTYLWFLNTAAIPGATTNTVTPTVNGSYRVRVTDGNGCVGYSTAFIFNNLAVESVNNADIKIFPNPANSVVHIQSPVSLRAIITGMEGQTVMEKDNATDLDISQLPNGLYMILLFDKNGERLVVQKLIKE